MTKKQMAKATYVNISKKAKDQERQNINKKFARAPIFFEKIFKNPLTTLS